MAYEFNGTNQWISAGSAPATAAPLTLYARFRSTSDSAGQTLVHLGTNGSDFNFFQIGASGELAGDPIRAMAYGTAAVAAATSTGYSINTWQDAAGVFVSSVSRFAYINANKSIENTTSQTPTAPNRINLGALIRVSNLAFVVGRLAECAVWTESLTDAEVSSLWAGFRPSRIRPQNLVFYTPLIRDLNDIKGGLALTNNNAATVADHPRVY